MRVLIQRVSEASVTVDSKAISRIGEGLLILLGVSVEDDESDLEWLVNKVANLRIFPDAEGVMNRSLLDAEGEALVVSQFTLQAATKKGNRPSYIKAARPEQAVPLYEKFVSRLEALLGKKVGTGEFGAMMSVALTNEGPVTIWIDSRNRE
jgi:D-tyrosyl-tRNA(Tyr) deacylase